MPDARFCMHSNALGPAPLSAIVSLLRTMSSLPPDTKAMRQTNPRSAVDTGFAFCLDIGRHWPGTMTPVVGYDT